MKKALTSVAVAELALSDRVAAREDI